MTEAEAKIKAAELFGYAGWLRKTWRRNVQYPPRWFYEVGVQEYAPAEIVTPMGMMPNPFGGKPLPLTVKGSGSSWAKAFAGVK